MIKSDPDYFNRFLSMKPPRQVDDTLANKLLDYFYPKFIRKILSFLAIFMLAISSIFLGIVISASNHRDELRLLMG